MAADLRQEREASSGERADTGASGCRGMRSMGLDFGAHTVGVALTDASGTLAQRLEIIRREKETHLRRTFARLEALITAHNVARIVIGLPLHMDGRDSERAEKTRAFGEQLARRTGLPVIYHDERLTSVAAEDILRETGVPREHWKDAVDMIAAEIILQDEINSRAGAETTGVPERM